MGVVHYTKFRGAEKGEEGIGKKFASLFSNMFVLNAISSTNTCVLQDEFVVVLTGREERGREQTQATDDHHGAVEKPSAQTIHSYRDEHVTRDLDGGHDEQHEVRVTGQLAGAQRYTVVTETGSEPVECARGFDKDVAFLSC